MFPLQGHHVLTFFESFCLLLVCAQSFLHPNQRGDRAREIKWHGIANIHHRPIRPKTKVGSNGTATLFVRPITAHHVGGREFPKNSESFSPPDVNLTKTCCKDFP